MENAKILFEKPTPDILKNFRIKSLKYKDSSIVESLKDMMSYIPLPSEKKKKDKCVEYLVKGWFSQKMKERYSEISPGILELEREIEIDAEYFKDNRGRELSADELIKLKIPMLLRAELDKDKGWKQDYDRRGDYDNYKLSLFSRIPKVHPNIRRAGKEALALAYKTYGEALGTEMLGDIIMKNPQYAPHPKDTKLIVLWKPKPSEIHIEVERIDNDPALVLEYDKLYLVSTWMEPDEEPFMHLMPKNYSLDEYMKT
ncbi:MAG: hypothetical protein JSV92_03920 [archaeon]|nr:MAG: hypothetical protein JSV92_03920 [archaeon]